MGCRQIRQRTIFQHYSGSLKCQVERSGIRRQVSVLPEASGNRGGQRLGPSAGPPAHPSLISGQSVSSIIVGRGRGQRPGQKPLEFGGGERGRPGWLEAGRSLWLLSTQGRPRSSEGAFGERLPSTGYCGGGRAAVRSACRQSRGPEPARAWAAVSSAREPVHHRSLSSGDD